MPEPTGNGSLVESTPVGRGTAVLKAVDQRILDSLVAWWQKTLRCQDWRVKIRWASAYELQGKMAIVERMPEKRVASILLGRPEHFTYVGEAVGEADPATTNWEVTLVHELLHLLFEPFDHEEDESPKDIAIHQAIHALAAALVELKGGHGAGQEDGGRQAPEGVRSPS